MDPMATWRQRNVLLHCVRFTTHNQYDALFGVQCPNTQMSGRRTSSKSVRYNHVKRISDDIRISRENRNISALSKHARALPTASYFPVVSKQSTSMPRMRANVLQHNDVLISSSIFMCMCRTSMKWNRFKTNSSIRRNVPSFSTAEAAERALAVKEDR